VDARDLTPESRVALLVPGSVAYAELVIALLQRGVFPVPMDVKLTRSEREALLAYLNPVQVVTSQEQLQELLGALADVRADVPADAPPLGRPIHLTSAPLRFATGTLLAGGRVVVPGPFEPETVTTAIREHQPTTMFCVPTQLQRLFTHWDALHDSGGGTPDLRSFRMVAHAGAPCPEWVKRRLIEDFPDGATWEFYGSTEGQFTACRSEEWLQRPGTLGQARPGRVMEADQHGQLWCVVPPHARFTYLGDPEKTAAAWRELDAGSAFTVGDLGRVDEAGYVFLDGRREDLIISGGVNVYPAEVERVLGEVPGVEDIAVFGVEDERWGQRVCAAVVGGADAGVLDVELLEDHARRHLAPAKRPKEYLRLDTLPRTPTGKVRRLDLPDLLADPPTRRPG